MRRILAMIVLVGAAWWVSSRPVSGQTVGYTSEHADGAAAYRITLETGDLDLFPALSAAYGIALDPSGGTLYGVVPGPDETPHLAAVDLTTLDQADRGPLAGVDHRGGGLTFDASGRLWVGDVLGNLFEVDPETAETGLVLATGLRFIALTACGNRLLALVGLSFPERGRLYEIYPDSSLIVPLGPERTELGTAEAGLDFDAEGHLWAVLDRVIALPGPSLVDDIVELDPADGAILSQLSVMTVGSSLAITPPVAVCPLGVPVTEIPTLGRWPLAALAGLLGLLGCGLVARRTSPNGREATR
jgi:hypothetical protein